MVPDGVDVIKQLQGSHDSPEDLFSESISFAEMDAVLAEMSQARELIRLLEECFVATESCPSGALTERVDRGKPERAPD